MPPTKLNKSILILFLLYCFHSFGQYSLEFGIGYKYLPIEKSENYISVTNIYNKKGNGVSANIGLKREFNSFFSHSYGFGYNYRELNYSVEYIDQANDNVLRRDFNNSFGSFQAYYLARVYPFKKVGFSFIIGPSIERTQFIETTDFSGNYKKDVNYLLKDGNFIRGKIGVAYDLKINNKWSINAQISYSKAFLLAWGQDLVNTGFFDYKYKDLNFEIGFNYNIGNSILTPKERKERALTDPLKDSLYNRIEFEVFYLGGYRRLNYVKPEDQDYHGFSSSNFFAEEEKNTFYGFGLGGSYSSNRFYSTLELSYQKYAHKIGFYYKKTSLSEIQNSYYIQSHSSETDYISYDLDRMLINIGVGVMVFHPKSKINIIPSLKVVNGVTLKSEVDYDYYIKSSVFKYMQDPSNPANFDWDSTFSPSRFSQKNYTISLLVGGTISAKMYKNFKINIDIHYAILSNSIFTLNENRDVDKFKFYNTIGIGYEIPLKTRVRPTDPPDY